MKAFVHQLRDDIAVVGWSCRLPGANSVDELWSLLLEGRCAVSRVPEDRFSLARFGHPRRQERGKSYSWSAGIVDDVWGFDPAVFGISPREAVQIDPQQRILLQLTWEALEDAGIRPSSIANTEVGVYVGASQTDYGHQFFGDQAIADAHFAPGTAVAILANRISYIYGLHGPSLTIDTACSSSLVAMHQAVEALRSGRIDTAIVAGTNLIASPASFIAFSQANMLSERGLCQAFSANADGFVRAEGAVVFVLRKAAHAQAQKNPIHGFILASDVNSDGRTNGISLPSLDAQEALLRRIYSRNSIDYDKLAFVEAHGTGTPVGDPIEATALGRAIGRNRATPLPIGSIKTNIGHLEPGSGMAGALKAMLALNHGILPPSLHFEEPSPHIEFENLNLSVCTQPLLLPKSAEQIAGVNSFGFGGTNAHCVVGPGRKATAPLADHNRKEPGVFALSANSGPALVELAREYSERVSQLNDQETATLASAVAHRRERQQHRIVVSSARNEDVGRALDAFISGKEDGNLTTGQAVGDEMPVAFVYSGNGSQWAGMGLNAYKNNAHFRARFDQADGYFKQIGGWSLKDAMFSDTLAERLPLTSIAQPLIFGIQAAATAALRAGGLHPAAVLGHSVGEVAAAEAAGILDLRTAIKVIYYRSTHQELTHGSGRMAAAFTTPDVIEQLGIEGLAVAAINSPRTVTVAGSTEALNQFKVAAAERGIAMLDLDLEYPFHTGLMAPIESRLHKDLRDIGPRDADTPFVSTVTGACLPGSRLDASYWWRNVREPVQFMNAVRAAAELGARYFVEVGARPTLIKHIGDSLRGEVNGFATLSILDKSDSEADPFDKARAKALVNGARLDTDKIFGPNPGPSIQLPHYPWQQQQFRFKPTVEAVGAEAERHPFAGARNTADTTVWRAHIDTAVYPQLADHVVGSSVIFPGTGFLEVGFAAAREWLKTDSVVLTEFEIFAPLDLTNGETRELMTRISAGSGTGEIFSRTRLSSAGWVQHCRFKIHNGNPGWMPQAPAVPAGEAELFDHARLYDVAHGSGLHYGPAFALVQKAVVHTGGKFISVQLAPKSEDTSFLLDPMRIDASAHGFFTMFPELRAVERGVTYIPVRLEESTLIKPNITPERAVIEVISKNERSLLTNCFIFGAKDELIAVLRGVRCQAISTRRMSSVDALAFVEVPRDIDGAILGQSGVASAAKDFVAAAGPLGIVQTANPTESELLIEGWATAAAYEIASALAQGGSLDVESMVASAQLPEHLRPWLSNILVNLEAAALVTKEGHTWTLIEDSALPGSASVVKALATEQQSRAAELLLAAAVTGFAGKLAKDRTAIAQVETAVSKSVLEFYHNTNIAGRETSDALYRLLIENKTLWPKDRALRILQVGFSPLAQMLLSSPRRDVIQLTVFEPDRRRYEAAELTLARHKDIKLVDAEATQELGQYDLIVSVGGLHRLTAVGLGDLKGMLAPHGILAAIEPRPSLFKDIVFGLDPVWFGGSQSEQPASPVRPAPHWQSQLEQFGYRNAVASLVQAGSSLGALIVAESATTNGAAGPAQVAAPSRRTNTLLVTSDEASPLAIKLRDAMKDAEMEVTIAAVSADFPGIMPDAVVIVPETQAEATDKVAALTQRCLDIRAVADKIGNSPTTLWLVFYGARASEGANVRPVETGAWAFSRVLANEYQKLDVRRIDVTTGLPLDVAAKRIHSIITSGTNETELQVDKRTVRAVRVNALRRALDSKAAPSEGAAVLQRRVGAGGQRVAWMPMERKRPAEQEIEVQVEATGLNFRDLMWSLGLLPEDMLEHGFSGPTLGLECAGRIVRIGSAVTDCKVDDKVLCFAGSAFATHVTIHQTQAVKLPPGMSCESAATIPVAFFTAYYSLVTQASLAEGEWVLVHGGAGAVGMAAIQIAHARGAHVIATAGSPAKRSLLRAMDVEHVLDSRSTTFVDDVRRITGGGVDVVLNSLAGEAMERSIACLRPFGRFIELGKRDYVTNTHIGLRPFRRNLTYYGVDVDQVIGARKEFGLKLFAEMMKEFEKGIYTPLPYSVFDGVNVAEAFHLMQQSSHIGKLVVRPTAEGVARLVKKSFTVRADGTHIISGAFGGFGLETAKWLVDKGARYLVMLGRKGANTPEAQAALRDLAARGVKVIAEPCDISDRQALEQMFEVIHSTMPPIAGVMHAAAVLDDALLVNLDAERFHRVLTPKVAGADNLDQLVRGDHLDYFIMFSSVTTLIGNPGQANYVAANAYMEGLARRRRQKGLPALAVGWGPISDVGMVARSSKLQSGLQKATGLTGMLSREALELMVQAIDQAAGNPDAAVITISPNDGSFGGDKLAVLRSPTYASFINRGQKAEGDVQSIDLHAIAAKEGIEVARRKVADVISQELAQVLHLREEEISQVRPLGEIGLDSLMAVELVMNLEQVFGTSIPLAGSSGGMTINDIADQIIAHVGLDRDREDTKQDAAVAKLVDEHHGEKIEAHHVEAIKGVMSEQRTAKRLLN
jgi:phthiocerol/phenolphthiocerol synthesis type-I polyketide synthase C